MAAIFSLGTNILALLTSKTRASSPATIHSATFIRSPLYCWPSLLHLSGGVPKWRRGRVAICDMPRGLLGRGISVAPDPQLFLAAMSQIGRLSRLVYQNQIRESEGWRGGAGVRGR